MRLRPLIAALAMLVGAPPSSEAQDAPAAEAGDGGSDAAPGVTQPRVREVAPPAGEEPSSTTSRTRVLSRWLGLQDSPVSIYGWIQNSFTGTPGFAPRNGSTVTVNPGRLANQWQGDQYYFIAEKVPEWGDAPDFGFRVDTLLGNDWQLTKSFGLFDHAFTPKHFAGLDLPQIYGEVHLPIAEGVALGVKGGRFYSPAGFESIQAINRPLYSVPYVLTYTPYTFFGALTSLKLGDRVVLLNGAVNGADRWINSNFHYSYLGGFHWDSEDGRNTVSSVTLVGPNQLPFFPNLRDVVTLPAGGYTVPGLIGRRNPFYNRSTLVYHSTVLIRKWGEGKKLTQAAEAIYVTQGNVLGYGPGGGPARINYYGGAHWLLYEFRPEVTGVARVEVFRDQNGFVLPKPDTYFEMTYGLILKPKESLWIRPEIRYDRARSTRPYDDGTRSGQITLAVDVILQF